MHAEEIISRIHDFLPQDKIRGDHSESAHFYRDCRQSSFEDASRIPSVTTKLGIIEKPYLKDWAARRALDVIRERLHDNEEIDDQVWKDAEHAHKKVLSDAGNTGTNVHHDVEKYIKRWIADQKRPADIAVFIEEGRTPSEYSGIRSAEEFAKAFDIEPIAAELCVVSSKHNFAGTFDALFIHRDVYKERFGSPDCDHSYADNERLKKMSFCLTCGREVTNKLVLADWKSSNSIKKDEYAWQSAAYAKALKEEAGVVVDECWVVRLSKDRPQYEVLKINNINQAYKEFKAISNTYDTLRARDTKDLLKPIVEPLIIKL